MEELGVLGAPGFNNPVTWDDSNAPLSRDRAYAGRAGVQVTGEDVAIVDARRENANSRIPFDDVDWVDDDDDDDIEVFQT